MGQRFRIEVMLAWAACTWAGILVGEHVTSLATLRWPMVAMSTCMIVLWGLGHVGGAVTAVVVMLGAISAGSWAWHGNEAVVTGPCKGVAVLRSDPVSRGAAVSVIVEVDGARHRVHAYGLAGRRLAQRSSGESVLVEGTCAPDTGRFARWDRINHVVGRFEPTQVSEQFSEGSRFTRAANRIRAVIVEGSSRMNHERQSLFLGLVIGDDRGQSEEMRRRFRESGLSHLTAVSGQNVAFLLILIGPLTRGRGRVAAWLITMATIAWFVVVTRAEPSIVRASVMAATAATITMLGRAPDTKRILASTVIALLMVDPMLAWSVGFGLSVGATFGLAWWTSWCRQVVGGGETLAATVAAQLGTMPLMLWVFGSVPVATFVTNPLAIPVAGMVMTIGLPLTIAASAIPALQSPVGAVMSVPVGFIDGVASLGASTSPHGWWNVLAWSILVGWMAWRRRHRTKDGGVAG